MTRKEQLKADLLKNFSDFQKIDPNVAPGGSDAANSIVAEGLADSIDRAIDDGIDLTFKGILRCSEINLLTDKKSGDLYTCSDAGVLNGSVQLPVTKTSVVLWTVDRFKLFLVVPEQVTPGSQISIDGFFSQTSRNPVENRLVTAALAATINAINLHVQNQENPHGVTAAQVGADPEGTAETLVSNHNSDESAHTDIRQLIEDEADERTDADTALQQQIDAIVSKSDVVAIVGTYVDLLALDTSTMFDNDIVKVLADESRQGKKTYYYWDLANETWTYIGSEAETYTKSEVDSMFSAKVDKVTGKGLSTNDFTDAAKAVTDNIFLATYNSTSYADIKAAYDSGKTILCRFTDSSHTVRVATFDRLTNSTTSNSYAYFASVTKSDAYELVASKTRYGTTTSWSSTSKTWGALAEKDNVTNADISGTIQDAHIASASTWNGKADKVSNATSGHLAGLDGDGNLTDSGVSPSDISSGIFIAEYGTTTIAQIEAAYNANKAMFVKMGGGNPGIALFTTRYTINGVHTYWFYRKYGRDYGANEDQHYAYVYIDSSGWHDYSFTSPKNRHNSTTDEYGAGSENAYGHVQLTNSVTQNSTKAITSGAVYTALQNLPQPAPEIFVAEFGVTSYEDIYVAVTSGKTVICKFSTAFFSPFGSVYLYSLGRNDESYVFSFAALVGGYYITASVDDQSGMWDVGWSKDLGSLLFNIDPSGSESNYVTERGTIKPIPPSAYPAITKDADYTIQTSTVVTLQQTNRLYKIHVRPSYGPHGDVRLNVSTGLTGVVFLDLKVGYDTAGCIYYTYNATYLKWTDIFGVEQKMRLYPDRYDGQYMPQITTEKTYFRLKVECYNGEIIAVTSFGDLHFEASGLVAQSVNSSKIADDSVTGPKIAADAVTNSKIANGAVGTTKLANNAVTAEKIANGSVGAINSCNHYVDWTLSGSSGGQMYVTKLPSGEEVDRGIQGALNNALVISGSPYPQETMMVLSVSGSGTATMYCNVGSLPRYVLFKLKIVNTSTQYNVKIVFRTNSSTVLAEWRKNSGKGTNSNIEYAIGKNEMNDIWFYRGGDSGSATTCYLVSNYNT